MLFTKNHLLVVSLLFDSNFYCFLGAISAALGSFHHDISSHHYSKWTNSFRLMFLFFSEGHSNDSDDNNKSYCLFLFYGIFNTSISELSSSVPEVGSCLRTTVSTNIFCGCGKRGRLSNFLAESEIAFGSTWLIFDGEFSLNCSRQRQTIYLVLQKQ